MDNSDKKWKKNVVKPNSLKNVDNSNNDKKGVAVQSNNLLNGRYAMTLLERRIFLKMVSMVKPEDVDFRDFQLDVPELIKDLNLEGNSLYFELRNATKKLIQHVCEMNEGGKLIQVALISSAIYDKQEGTLKVHFDPALKPYLLELRKNFTVFRIAYALKLRSFYSLRIYELLNQFSSTGYRVIKLEDLRFSLGITSEYHLYGDLKKRVLIQAQNELTNTDIPFNFEEIKTGRKVTGIKFTFTPIPSLTAEQEQLIIEANSTEANKPVPDRAAAFKRLLELNITITQAKQIMAKTNDSAIFKAAHEVQISLLDQSIKNKAAYAFSIFKAKFLS